MNNEELDKTEHLVEVADTAKVVATEPLQEPETEPREEPQKPSEKGVKEELRELLGRENNRRFPGWMDLLSTAGVFLFSILASSLVMLLMMRGRGVEALSPDITFVCYLVQMLPVVAFILFLRHRAGRGSGLRLGIRGVNLPMVLWGVLLLLASGVVIEPLLELFPTEPYDGVKDAIGLGGWAILSTVVAAPILEEVLFRGLIFESCRERFGGGSAVLISALLFGLIHIVPVQMINAFVVGLILGYVYLKTNSLLSVIILHAINNAIAYATMALLGESANVTLRELIPSPLLYWILYGLSAVLFVFAMITLLRTLRDNTEVE
jgi:membrane protease YdiL (CAAX protease family)